jgi:heme exporter protein A
MPVNNHSDNFLLRLDRVTHFFDQRLVFKNVSLLIEPGTVTLVAGPNGAGKTTLMNIMSGLIRPSDGIVKHNVSRDRTAYLGHNTFVYSGLSALDNLKFWAKVYGRRAGEDQLMEMLSLTGLKAFAHEKAGYFSRGMAQRLSLARVLMLKPLFLLLDEPATGLDPDSRNLLRRKITQSAQSGTAVVWVSHTLEEDLDLTDKILFLENKKQTFYGTTRDFKSRRQDKVFEH